MGHEEHKDKAPDEVRCKIITVSDTRSKENDESGKMIKELLEKEGHGVCSYVIVKDDIKQIKEALSTKESEVYIINGGTGVSRRDVTTEAVYDIIDKELSGFGELFRKLSFDEIGSAAFMSRAIAGINEDEVVFALPGSASAVELGMKELILPELGHIVYEVNK